MRKQVRRPNATCGGSYVNYHGTYYYYGMMMKNHGAEQQMYTREAWAHTEELGPEDPMEEEWQEKKMVCLYLYLAFFRPAYCPLWCLHIS